MPALRRMKSKMAVESRRIQTWIHRQSPSACTPVQQAFVYVVLEKTFNGREKEREGERVECSPLV